MRTEFILLGLIAIWASGLFFGSVYILLNLKSKSEPTDAKYIVSLTNAGWGFGIGGIGLLALGFFG